MPLAGRRHHQPKLRRLKQLTYLSPVISILSLILLLYVYTPARTSRFWSQYYRSTGTFQSQNPTTVPPESVPAQPDSPLLFNAHPHVKEKVPLVAVNGTHTLLLSAYMEHRTFRQEVRVIAVALRTEAVAYYCTLSCQGQRRISVGDSIFHSDHFGYEYGTVDILCPLPVGCEAPSHVAVTSIGTDVEKEQPVFLEVLNQKTRSDSFPHNFTVCFSTMFGFSDVLQLVQSMEMLRLLGVTRVVIYKTSCSPDTQRILDYYTHTGLVEVIPWSMSSHLNVSAGWQPEDSPGQIHYYGQIPALNDCVYRYMYQTRYIALHDIDELILPQQVDSWPELLPLLELQYGVDYGYMFQNYVFSTATVASSPPPPPAPPPPATSSRPPHGCCPEWRGVPGVNILAHLFHEPNDQPFTNFKIIVNPRAVFSATVHGLLDSRRGCFWVDNTEARMYHTRAPMQSHLTAEQLVYDGRLLDYSTRLIPAVNTVLTQTGLIALDHANSSSPNGKKCYTCKGEDCSDILSCSGDEDRCISTRVAFGDTEITTKGCVSKSLCVSSNIDMIPGMSGQVSCCEGDLCNSATSTAVSLLLLVAAVVSVALFN